MTYEKRLKFTPDDLMGDDPSYGVWEPVCKECGADLVLHVTRVSIEKEDVVFMTDDMSNQKSPRWVPELNITRQDYDVIESADLVCEKNIEHKTGWAAENRMGVWFVNLAEDM